MIIVKVIGGLGNQMFQYALYKALGNKFNEVKLDIEAFKTYNHHNGYELERIFNIRPVIASADEINKLSDVSKKFKDKLRRKIFGKKKTHYVEQSFPYNEDIFKYDNRYLEGFWQSEKYFINIEQQIKQDFKFKNKLEGKNKDIIEKIHKSNSVSIHIRRGDYISNPEAAALHGGICDLEYYKKAISYIKSQVNNAEYFVFSDDMQWVKENLKIDKVTYIDWNTKDYSYIDMQLMITCKHNIIANSTFSWWGAFLNDNKEKIIIAPKRWFNNPEINTSDIIPESWIKI